jgi:phosphorylated CTD-interacting factor 1
VQVWCYPVQFALPCPRLPTVEFVQDKEKTYLRYRGGDPPVVISNLYFSKLEQLYRYGCADDRKFDLFLTRCYMLIKRYNAYFGNTLAGEGSQNQGGLPIPVLEALNKHFQVFFRSVLIPVNQCCGTGSGSFGSYVFGPPGSGSISQRYGSFHHQANIARKTLTVL